jgi:ATP-dependent RNA helicase DDX49/DBP8
MTPESRSEKRVGLTVDDLARMQDNPKRKRPRLMDEEDLHRSPYSALSTDQENEEGGLLISSEEENALSSSSGPRKMSPPEEHDVVNSRFKVTHKAASGPMQNMKTVDTTTASWISMGVSLPLQAALSGMSIRHPTEIQAACIPPLLEGELRSFVTLSYC